MRAPLETFAGLLDRSVQEIAIMAADARVFDASRVGALADIWDNNTFPLVSAACAPRLDRNRQARTGLLWMAGLGAARRELMVDLDPALDRQLPAAATGRPVHRDYQARVFPGSFPVTTEIITGLATDYDLTDASVRRFTVRPGRPGLQVEATLAAPRRFVPSTGRVARDGSRKPWPAAPLHFTFGGVTDLQFDAADRHGVSLTFGDAGLAIAIGQQGTVQATTASVWPDDPRWYESAAGRAADLETPHGRPDRRPAVVTSSLTSQQQAAARALTELMLRIRLVSYYPELTATIPAQQICRVTAGAGTAILAASDKHGPAREHAFAELAQHWRAAPKSTPPAPIPSGPAVLRYIRYDEPHADYDVQHDGVAVLVAAVPDTGTAAPWRLASEKLAQPASFHVTMAAFDGIRGIRRDAGALAMNDMLNIQETP
ncbi:hypothetical protein [Actinoplanes palleronii]|uniref:hypothetical protein n=1 Tax=Actinoplanes palleronii TaxID=113570 RepID=UPI001941A831|nr:hypothetical protein [Actinoplanes palleronii]